MHPATFILMLAILTPSMVHAGGAPGPEVAVHDLIELPTGLSTSDVVPFDASVTALVTLPDGEQALRPTFWSDGAWQFRFRPLQAGEHTVDYLADGETITGTSFMALDASLPGPIHAEGLGFRRSDGGPFVPLGLNLGWSVGGGVDDYQRWFGELSAAGGTFARIWITHFTAQDPEWTQLGSLDEQAAANVDAILDLADDQGLLLMPVLWQHSELETTLWSSWDTNPYNEDNGGPCPDSACFFQNEAALAYQRVFLDYAVARWGPHPALGAWEVMNEVDGISGVSEDIVVPWARTHADTIRTWEDGMHPVSWSSSMPAHAVAAQDWDGADFSQVHSYLLASVEPVASGVAALLDEGAPVLVGEWGLDWFGDGDREDVDGISWHNANWAALASGSAGNALTWWWDDHVEPHDLWWRLEGPAAITAGLDLPGMGPIPVGLDGQDVEALGRADGDQALVWIHDTRSVAPFPYAPTREGVVLDLPSMREANATFHDPTNGATVDESATCDGTFVLPSFEGDLVALVEASPCEDDLGPEPVACACGSADSRRGGPWSVALVVVLLGSGLRRRLARDGRLTSRRLVGPDGPHRPA